MPIVGPEQIPALSSASGAMAAHSPSEPVMTIVGFSGVRRYSRPKASVLSHGKTKEIVMDPSKPSRVIKIIMVLEPKREQELIVFLWVNQDVFAWSAFDMPGILRDIPEHHLHMFPDAKTF